MLGKDPERAPVNTAASPWRAAKRQTKHDMQGIKWPKAQCDGARSGLGSVCEGSWEEKRVQASGLQYAFGDHAASSRLDVSIHRGEHLVWVPVGGLSPAPQWGALSAAHLRLQQHGEDRSRTSSRGGHCLHCRRLLLFTPLRPSCIPVRCALSSFAKLNALPPADPDASAGGLLTRMLEDLSLHHST